MSLSLVSTVGALATHRTLLRANAAMTSSAERLSTGRRINRAADDAAGLAISEGLRSQVNGMTVAVRNSREGINLLQVADGALDGTTSVLHRMRDLAVQAANTGAQDAPARAAVQAELGQLTGEITRIARTTTYNGIPLLDGHYRGVFQVGAAADDTVTVVIGAPGPAMDAAGLGLDGVDVTGATSPAPTVTHAVSDDDGVPSPGRLDWPGDFITPGVLEANYRRLSGTITYGGRTFDLAGVDYSGAVTAQDHIDAITTAALAALGTSYIPLVATATSLRFQGETPAVGSTTADAAALDPVFTGRAGAGADDTITRIDDALDEVTSLRARLGAVVNRFEHSVARLGVSIENTTASMARITDTDVAAEMTRLAGNEVLAQAATAMLAQVNHSGQSLLSLLN